MTDAMLKIGQVHARLRKEFPDLELSKIRYYDDMGLVVPKRTKSGYRNYTERDVECLRLALTLANEDVPLRTVRLRLIERGLLDDTIGAKPVTKRAAKTMERHAVEMAVPESFVAPAAHPAPAPVLRAVPAPVVTTVPLDAVPMTMSLSEFQTRSGISPSLLNQIVAAGIVTPGVHGGSQFLRASDLDVAQAAARLLANGADVRLLNALRRVVEREIGILGDLTAGLRNGAATEVSQRAFEEAQQDFHALRQAFHGREISDFFRA